jgi:homoserine kinase
VAPQFRDGPVQVRVPATSANLGPGFDSFGLALSRFDDVTAEVAAAGLVVEVSGEAAANVPDDDTHLIVSTMRRTFSRLGVSPAGLRLTCLNRIPHGRGLGSSAAAIVAGVQLARALVIDGAERLDDAAALALATDIEGHPDNVAACLLGGFTVAWTDDGVGRATRLEPVGVRPVVFIPTEQSATATARAALPRTVPHVDAAFNAGRAALLVVAITGRPELLFTATEDRLHQGYRESGMPPSTALLAELRMAGIPAVISGAGSTVLALARTNAERTAALECTPAGWEGAGLAVAGGAEPLVP